MKLFYFLALFLVLTISNLLAQTTTTSPRIIRSIPAFGDCDVDPNLKEIELEFDQDMDGRFSILEDPDLVPIIGDPVWKTKRILTITVALGPNRYYRMPMNSNNFVGFRNEAGVPMDATYLAFRTKTTIHPSTVDTVLFRTNYEKFCTHFLTNYSYKDLHSINWKKLLDSIKPTIIKSEFENEFAIRLLQVLKRANDPHLSVTVNGKHFPCADIRITPLVYNYNAIFNELVDVQPSRTGAVWSGMVGEAGYILIQTLQTQYKEDIDFGIGILRDMKDAPAIIIDLRLNTGGDEALAKSMVSTLLSNAITYEKIETIDVATGLFNKVTMKTLNPSATSTRYKGKIFVLTSNRIMSSAESMVLMLSQMPNVQIVGSKTYGSSGNPLPYKATGAVTVNIPSWKAYDADGKLIEGNGIEPDVKLEFPEEKFIAEDPIFDYVKNHITGTGTELVIETGQPGFQVFPNPVKDIARIRLSNVGNAHTAIQLIDINGRMLIDQPSTFWSSADNSLNVNLALYQLKPGIYFLKLVSDGKASVQKLVYQP